MNFRKLKIFYNTANYLNMTKVAKEMYVSQPSISQSIHELEQDIGVKLFDRIGKKIYLTHEGEIFLNYTRRILNLYDESIKTLTDSTCNNGGKIIIGASTTIGSYILPEILNVFSKNYPKIEISLIIENTQNIANLILDNKIDFAFIEGSTSSIEIVQESIWIDELVFICSKKHRFSSHKVVKGKEIAFEKFIMREYGSGTAQQVINFFKENDINWTTYLELGNSEAIKRMVNANLGIACLSKKIINDPLCSEELNYFRVEEGSITREMSLIYHKDKFLSSIMKIFIDIAKEYEI